MNPAFHTTYITRFWNPLNGFYYKLLQELLVRAGEEESKYNFLAPSLCGNDDRFQVLEKRKAAWVEALVAAYTAGVDPETLPDLKGCETIIYADLALLSDSDTLLQYDPSIQALLDDRASIIMNPTGVNNSLVFTAKNPGAQGNEISIQYLDPGGVTAALSVNVTGKTIVVRLGRAASAINTTATALKAAIDGNAASAALVTVANDGADTGAGLVTALPKTMLLGGTDSLDMLVTANNAIPVGTIKQFLLAGALENYELVESTDAESSPAKVRANDFHLTDNPRVWFRRQSA